MTTLPPNPNEPIPNDPFYYPETSSIQGPAGPVVIGEGLEITPSGQMIAIGGGPAVTYLVGGPGIYVSSNTGTVNLYNTGVLQLNSGTGIQVTCTAPGTFTVTNTAPAFNAGGTVTQVNTGDGLIGGPITTNGTIALSNTGVGAGTYQNATVTVDAKGRVTAASPGTAISTISGTLPISVTSGSNAVISIGEGSSTVPGVLRICDSTALFCDTVAASLTAVKNAYDLGATALPCSVLTARGDLISAAAAGIPLRVPVGADGTLLKACSACSSTGGLTWDTVTLCSGTVTSVTAGTGLTGGTITESGTIALDTACVIAPTILPSQGSLLTATGPNTPVALGVGSNGQVLAANNLCVTGLEWCSQTPAVPCSAFNLKGDILVGTSPATFTALSVGVNGSVLVACSACTAGLTWIPGQSVIQTCEITGKGALITGSAANVPGTLAVGTDSYVLSANSSCLLGLEWIAISGGTVTGITASSPLSVDSTNPEIPALSIQAASTTQVGVVQLNDTINSTSSVEAATANTVKMAYDLASSASATAATGVANAALAQADATQALTNASTAQTTANQAVVDAGAAQSDATQALSDSAAAQSSANQALLDASAAQDAADLAGLDAQAAQADATQALTNAATAQATASAALPLSGGTLTGPVTFAAGQTIPTSSIQSASTTQEGLVQLNDTVSSTSVTQALTASQGKNLQDQINALAVGSNLTLAGTLDASTGNLVTVTTEGSATGFAIGSPLPSAAAGNDNFFVIATVASFSYTPPGGVSTQVHVGDWFLSNGSVWEFLDVGFQAAYASTTAAGIVELATDIETQAGTDANVVVSPYALQSKVSDSTSTTSSTTIASSTAVKAAYDAGIQGQTDAAAAQSDANQALLDAAGAQTSANNAQSTANQAVLDAGAAQSDANQALLDAASAQTAANNAQSTADQGVLDAAAAQATADAAVPDSTFTALGDLLVGTGAGAYSKLGAGTNGQVLYACSTTPTGVCWGSVTSGSGTVTSITAGTGLTGGTITTSGTLALDTACVIVPSTLAAKGDIITATAASTPTALGVGTDGQVLFACSSCATGLSWATPQTSPFITYTTSAISYTSGTPILVAVWNGGFMQGTITLDMVGYGGVTPFWDIFLSGDATNANTGWYQTAFWPPTSDGLSQGTWYVDFPVYPSSNNGKWEFYFSPTQNSLNPSSFTFFFRTNSVPTWQI